jgi:hypothetical protein
MIILEFVLGYELKPITKFQQTLLKELSGRLKIPTEHDIVQKIRQIFF